MLSLFSVPSGSKTSLSASKVSIRSNRIGPQPDESSNMSQTNGSYNLGADFEMRYPLNRNRDMEGGLQRWESSEELDLSLHQVMPCLVHSLLWVFSLHCTLQEMGWPLINRNILMAEVHCLIKVYTSSCSKPHPHSILNGKDIYKQK